MTEEQINKIINKTKQKIAISQMKKEGENRMKIKQKTIQKVAVVAFLVITITGIVFAKDIGNLINNIFGRNASDGVQIAVENGYIQEVEPTYIESDGIDISVDSFLMDDYNFDMNFKVKLDNKYDIQKMDNLQPLDMKVVDENEKIVFLTSEQEKIMFEENKKTGTPNEHPLFWGGYGMTQETINEHELMFHLTAYGSEEHKFPKSKKLYITFSKVINRIGTDGSFKDVYTGNWNFELDVPKEMYNRETIIYKVKSCSDENTKVGNATLSNTAFKISIPETTTDKVDYNLLHARPPKKISDMIALGNEYVETSDGKRFEIAGRSDGDGGYSLPSEAHKIVNYSQTFNLTKFDATDILKVHIFTNKGEEIVIEYEV